jgi:outer membrane biosynthesis protein TonB
MGKQRAKKPSKPKAVPKSKVVVKAKPKPKPKAQPKPKAKRQSKSKPKAQPPQEQQQHQGPQYTICHTAAIVALIQALSGHGALSGGTVAGQVSKQQLQQGPHSLIRPFKEVQPAC